MPALVLLSQKGTKAQSVIPTPNIMIPKSSPLINSIFPGSNFNIWNIPRKYHSGLIPIGADENGSALFPNSHGKYTASIAKILITINHISSSLKTKFGKKGMLFFSLLLLNFHSSGSAMPCRWISRR